jgi:dihydroxyacetone kinase-like predicted kinase
MALCDGTVVSCAAGRDECLRGLAETLADAVYVVLYYGENVHYQEASDAARLIAELAPDADVDFANGDQPLYDFILSVS